MGFDDGFELQPNLLDVDEMLSKSNLCEIIEPKPICVRLLKRFENFDEVTAFWTVTSWLCSARTKSRY